MRRYVLSCVLLSLLLLPLPASAEEPITWLTFYKTKPGRGGEFVDLLKKYDQPVWDRLVDEGVINGWGIVTQEVRADLSWTYATWVTMPDYAAQLEIERVWDEVMSSRTAHELKVEGDSIRATFEIGGRDLIVSHLAAGHASDMTGDNPALSVFLLSSWKAKPGKESAVLSFYDETLKPVFESLAAAEVVTHYGLFVQDLHAQPDWTHTLWYRVRNRGGLDRVREAFRAADQERSEEQRPSLLDSARELFEPDSHRDMLLRELVRSTR
jgi:hypothetical protein